MKKTNKKVVSTKVLCNSLIILSALIGTPSAFGGTSGFHIFGGGEAGPTLLSRGTGPTSQDGYQIRPKLIASYYLSRWVLDGALGWSFTSTSSDFQSVETRAGFGELSPRYRIGQRWQLGPSLNMYYGTDVTYGASSETQDVSLFGGAQALYDMPLDSRWNLRVSFQVLTDLTVDDRQLYAGLLGLQVGMPVDFGTDREIAGLAQPLACTTCEVKPPVQIIQLDNKIIHFNTASHQLTPRARLFLNELGKFLAARKDLWKTVEIHGHTDVRGTKVRNKTLAENRAASVRKALIEGGLVESQSLSRGFGQEQPIDPENTEYAWAMNRRVELQFEGAEKPELIYEEILNIEKKIGGAHGF